MTTPFKVIAFDVDGTLVSEKSSWITLHKYFKSDVQAKKHLASYNAGDIDYPTFMRWDIGLWPKPLHVDQIKSVLHTYTLAPDANPVIDELKKKYEVVLISAGIDFLVEDVARKLGIKHSIANGIEINKKGLVTGDGIFNVDLSHKEIAMKSLLSGLNCTPKDCIAVGDSVYDESFLNSAGLSIAKGSKSSLKEKANYAVENLEDILSLDLTRTF